MDTQSAISFYQRKCGYSLEAALSNVNDSFTQQINEIVIRHVMSTHNLHFFREIYRKRFNNL